MVQVVYIRPLRRGTFVNRHKSTQKDFASATAQEGIKMTALRGKSRISLPLRLQLSCAEPIFLWSPLSSANSNGEWELIYALKTYSIAFQVAAFCKKIKSNI